MDVAYRAFRNTDPPGLARVWNEAVTGRGAAILPNASPLEQFVLDRPYFDAAGLIVAEAGGEIAGFVHAGFGSDAEGHRLDYGNGVICAILTRPAHRRQGIGAELLRRAEAYLRERGAKSIYAGCMKPLCPFYWGLYGGSEPSGILLSDPLAEPFLLKHDYAIHDRCFVFQRSLTATLRPSDARFPTLRRLFTSQIDVRPTSSRWFEEAVLAPFEISQFQLRDESTGVVRAEAGLWEMELFGWRWQQPAVGLIDLRVDADFRRRGLAKLLLVQVFQYLSEHFYTILEAQTMAGNEPAIGLYRSLGFEQVDEGRVYRKPE